MEERKARQERAERTRARIIEVAGTAFAEHGYDGISLNDIVKLSTVSKGAFYFHFPSKEELAEATFAVKQHQLMAKLSGDDDRGPGGAADQLADMLRRRNRLMSDDPSLRCVVRLGNELNVRKAPGSGFASFHEIPVRAIADVVREGQQSGEFRTELDAEAVAEAIFAWVVGIDTLSVVASDGKDLDERSEQLLAILLPALRVQRNRAPSSKQPSAR